MCVNLAAVKWSYTCAERGEQIPYCFSFFECGELYFMGDEKQILLEEPFCFTGTITSFSA